MALTINRPNYTAAQLNTAFTDVRDALATVLPDRILTVAGMSNFTALDIYEDDEWGSSVVGITSVIEAFTEIANIRNAGQFSVRFDGDVSAYVVDVHGRVNKPTLRTFNTNITPAIDMQRNPLISARPRGSFSLSSLVGNNSFSLGDNPVSKLPLYARVYYFSAAGTNMATAYETDGGLSNAPSNALGGYEVFDSKGYNEWYVGVATTINLTAFSTLQMGYNDWNVGTGTTLGTTEYFECGWSEGVKPIVVGVTRIEENLTAQINGSATTFTTKRPYKSGTLQAIWNGQVQYEGTVSETSSSTFSTTFTPTPGDVLIITYEQSEGGINRISFY